MNWLTLIWSISVGACLTLGLMHLVVWCKAGRRGAAHLAFTVAALSVAGVAVGEMRLMAARSPEDFALIQRWIHVPVATMVAGIVIFVAMYFGTSRRWLGCVTLMTRAAALLVNFLVPVNVNYHEIGVIGRVMVLGQSVSVVADSVPSPWGWIPVLSSLLMVIYVGDAAWRLWRTGGLDDRRRACVVGGSIMGFVLAASLHATLIHIGILQSPYMISFFFLAILMAMAHELSHDVISAARLSEELEEKQKHMTQAAAAARLALWTWDIPADSIWVTPEGRGLYGVRADERVSIDRFLATVHGEDREAVRQELERVLGGSGVFSHDYRVVLPDGQIRWITAVGKVECSANGRPSRLRGVSMDISDRRRTELEMAEQRSELAHLSRVTSLGQLSGAMAHELNQPLSIILSNAQAAQRLLEREPADVGELKEILADIVDEGRRAGEVIKRLRSLLKREDPRQVRLSCTEVIRDVLRLTQSELVVRGVVVEASLPEGLPEVLADSVQLQQVLLNLMTNGCDAMEALPAPDRVLHVACSSQGTAVRISIRDRGRGLPDGDPEGIFKPFYTTKTQGLGIGLAITRSIVEAHGGRVWAEPNEGVGTTFHIELPALPPPT